MTSDTSPWRQDTARSANPKGPTLSLRSYGKTKAPTLTLRPQVKPKAFQVDGNPKQGPTLKPHAKPKVPSEA